MFHLRVVSNLVSYRRCCKSRILHWGSPAVLGPDSRPTVASVPSGANSDSVFIRRISPSHESHYDRGSPGGLHYDRECQGSLREACVAAACLQEGLVALGHGDRPRL